MAVGKRLAAARGAWICFEDEAGQTLRPPKARTWGRRGQTPVVTVTGKGSGRISIAGLLCLAPGQQGRLLLRTITHRGRQGERTSFTETDYIALLDTAHRALGAPIVLCWDNLNVRHEAPPIRAGMKGPRRRSVAADRLKLGASRFPETRDEVGSSPDNAGTCRYCQTVRVRQA